MKPAPLAAALMVGLAAAVNATPTPKTQRAPIVAVPYYTPHQHAEGLIAHGLAPRAAEFARQSATLEPALRALCEAGDATTAEAARVQARSRWAQAVSAWEQLASISVGPLAERRSARQIDFTPTRPELIERAVRSAPADAAAMEAIGSPAKGLPALEWLLWTKPAAPGSPACGYARQVALDIEREALALAQAFDAARADADDAAREALFAEALNQWLGGIEALRWKHMDKPLRTPPGRGGTRGFPREASGTTASSWQAQWQALRGLGAADGPPPQPGQGRVPFETYLRGLGLNPLADRLSAQVRQVDARMHSLQPQQTARVRAAALSLAALKRLVETQIAPALKVSIGFSDADGD